jgi:hypothetical protein
MLSFGLPACAALGIFIAGLVYYTPDYRVFQEYSLLILKFLLKK